MEASELYDYAEKSGIEIISGLHKTKKAFCFASGDVKGVSIDYRKIESAPEEKAVLFEEVGHIESDCLYYLSDYLNPCRRMLIAKAEAKAADWAAAKQIPVAELKAALKKYTEIYELAEHFNVLEPVVIRAYNYWKRKDYKL